MAEIKVPTLGESIVEATIGKWLKRPGEQVAAGDVLVELETDKVNIEVRTEEGGVLERIDRNDGATVAVGEVLGSVSANGAAAAVPAVSGAGAAADPSAAPASAAAATDAYANASPAASSNTQAASDAPASANGSGAAPTRAPNATPTAVNVATQQGVNLAGVTGSGPGGRVMKQDVVAPAATPELAPAPATTPATAPASAPAVAAKAAPTPTAPAVAQTGREERVRMSRRRQTIAKRLVEAQRTAAMLTTFNEVDMSAIMDVRKRRGDAFLKRHNVKLGFMSFFVKAVVGALKFQPRLNAEIQGDEVVLKKYYDIGIAVAADEGLVVPVLRNADALSFAGIEQQIADLGKRARENTLGLADLQGGTFTITNGGIFGSLMSTPILNAPQVGILGMHAIKERAVVVDGQVVVRPMMYLALSYDHRIVDGSEAVRFLVRVKELIEDPESLLLDA